MEKLVNITNFLCQTVPDPLAIYLFGSRASHTDLPTSDYDIAILAMQPIDESLLWELQGRLAQLLGAEVDLVDLRRASAVMRVQVLANCQLLFEADFSARALFEAIALSDYARLNEERRAILEEICLRGNIYG